MADGESHCRLSTAPDHARPHALTAPVLQCGDIPSPRERPKLVAMKRRAAFDPRRLDVDAFVDDAAMLEGRQPLADLERLAASVLPEAPDATVHWRASGTPRPGADRQPQRWIDLHARARVHMTCQRCLEPVAIDLDLSRAIRFVPTEAEAERLDLESDDDVLATSRRLDLLALVEDELVLALPAVPRHEDCRPPARPPSAAEPSDDTAARTNPFAVLRGRHGAS